MLYFSGYTYLNRHFLFLKTVLMSTGLENENCGKKTCLQTEVKHIFSFYIREMTFKLNVPCHYTTGSHQSG